MTVLDQIEICSLSKNYYNSTQVLRWSLTPFRYFDPLSNLWHVFAVFDLRYLHRHPICNFTDCALFPVVTFYLSVDSHCQYYMRNKVSRTTSQYSVSLVNVYLLKFYQEHTNVTASYCFSSTFYMVCLIRMFEQCVIDCLEIQILIKRHHLELTRLVI